MVGSLKEAIEDITADGQPPQKIRKKDPDLEVKVTALHEYVKLIVSVEMVDHSKELHIFPRIYLAAHHSKVVLDALGDIIKKHEKRKARIIESSRLDQTQGATSGNIPRKRQRLAP